MVAAQLDDIRRQADLVAYDYERMMREAKAANTGAHLSDAKRPSRSALVLGAARP
jgi:hypothetical protein